MNTTERTSRPTMLKWRIGEDYKSHPACLECALLYNNPLFFGIVSTVQDAIDLVYINNSLGQICIEQYHKQGHTFTPINGA